MTSSLDPTGEKIAYKQMLACMLANTAIPCAMSYLGMLLPVFLVPFLATQARAIYAVH